MRDLRLTERRAGYDAVDGRSVWQLTVQYDAADLQGTPNFVKAHGISGLDRVLRIEAAGVRASDGKHLPIPMAATNPTQSITLSVDDTNVNLNVDQLGGNALASAELTLFYVKSAS